LKGACKRRWKYKIGDSEQNKIKQGKKEVIELKTKRLWLLIGSICLALVLALPLVVACAGPAPTPTPTPTPEEKVLLLGGCGVGGSFYALATALMKVINEKVPDYRAIAQVTGCSVENCRLLNERKVYNAQASVGVASDAYAGTGSFDSPIPLAVTNYSFTAYTWFLTLDDSIKSIQDLKGKRVSMGDPGGGTAVVISGVLKALGITEADFTPIYLNESAAAGALRDGSIDVFALVGGTQQASITEVTTVEDVHFISLTKEEAEKGAAAVKGRLPISITKLCYLQCTRMRMRIQCTPSPRLCGKTWISWKRPTQVQRNLT